MYYCDLRYYNLGEKTAKRVRISCGTKNKILARIVRDRYYAGNRERLTYHRIDAIHGSAISIAEANGNTLQQEQLIKNNRTPPKVPRSNEEILNEFIKNRKEIQETSYDSLLEYISCLECLAAFTNKSFILVTKVDAEHFRDELLTAPKMKWKRPGILGTIKVLETEALGRKTIKNIINVVKTFYEWLCSAEYVEKNPFKQIKSPKVRKKKSRHPPSLEVIEALCNIPAKEGCDPVEWKVALECLRRTGARRGEICGLMVENIDFNHDPPIMKLATFKQKNANHDHTERTISIPSKVIIGLKTLSEKHKTGYIFPSLGIFEQSTPLGMNREYGRRITKLWIPLAKKLYDKMDLHTFRHYASSALTNAGVPEKWKLRIIGHSGTGSDANDVSEMYVHVDYKVMLRYIDAIP